MREQLCVVVRVYNEAEWIVEFVEYYLIQGADRVLVYDDHSTDALHRTLEPYVRDGRVEVTMWDHRAVGGGELGLPDTPAGDMCAAFNHALGRMRGVCRWLLFVDADEFLLLPRYTRLVDALPQLERYAGVAVCWQRYGTNGVARLSPRRSCLDAFTRHENSDPGRPREIKLLVQPALVRTKMSVHNLADAATAYNDDVCSAYVVRIDGVRVDGAFTAPPLWHEARIVHYWTRDEHYLRTRKSASHIRAGYQTSVDDVVTESQWMNAERSDGAIERYAPLMNKLLATDDYAERRRLVNEWTRANVEQIPPAPIRALDWKWYATRYADDLTRAGVPTSSRAAIERHWVERGTMERRQPNAICEAVARHRFDWHAYAGRYPDLAVNGCTTMDACAKHWLTWGMREGRVCTRNE